MHASGRITFTLTLSTCIEGRKLCKYGARGQVEMEAKCEDGWPHRSSHHQQLPVQWMYGFSSLLVSAGWQASAGTLVRKQMTGTHRVPGQQANPD